MRILGTPLWAIVVVACILAPLVVRAWIDAEQRRTRERTIALLKSLGLPVPDGAPARTARGARPARRDEAGVDVAASTEGPAAAAPRKVDDGGA